MCSSDLTDVFGLGCLLHFAVAQTSPLEIAPQLAAIGAIAALLTEATIVVEKNESS